MVGEKTRRIETAVSRTSPNEDDRSDTSGLHHQTYAHRPIGSIDSIVRVFPLWRDTRYEIPETRFRGPTETVGRPGWRLTADGCEL